MTLKSMPRITDGTVKGASFDELLMLSAGAAEIDFRADIARLDPRSIPGFRDDHPGVEAVTLTCDPVLGNVIVARGRTKMTYDRPSRTLTAMYDRRAFCAEAASGAVIASRVSVSGWVKARYSPRDGAWSITRASKPLGRSAVHESEHACVGGHWPAETDAGAALAMLVTTSAAISLESGGGRTVETLVRPDACAHGPDTLRTRYAFKHAIMDYGGFEKAEREEPGLIRDVFADRRMWLWSFTEAPADVWGGTELLGGVYEARAAGDAG